MAEQPEVKRCRRHVLCETSSLFAGRSRRPPVPLLVQGLLSCPALAGLPVTTASGATSAPPQRCLKDSCPVDASPTQTFMPTCMRHGVGCLLASVMHCA